MTNLDRLECIRFVAMGKAEPDLDLLIELISDMDSMDGALFTACSTHLNVIKSFKEENRNNINPETFFQVVSERLGVLIEGAKWGGNY